MQYTDDKDESLLVTYGDEGDSMSSGEDGVQEEVFKLDETEDVSTSEEEEKTPVKKTPIVRKSPAKKRTYTRSKNTAKANSSDSTSMSILGDDVSNGSPASTAKSKDLSEEKSTSDNNSNNSNNSSEEDSFSYSDETLTSQPEQEREIFDIQSLRLLNIEDLTKLADELGVVDHHRMNFHEMRQAIIYKKSETCHIFTSGYIEINHSSHFAFMRSEHNNYATKSDDVYIAPSQVKKLNLRPGDKVSGIIRLPTRRSERYCALVKATAINDQELSTEQRRSTYFDDLTPIHPDRCINLEIEDPIGQDDVSARLIDMIAPIGFGQRALIVAPPKTGKTILLQNIARSIAINHPDAHLIVLLIDERPEEVTEMRRFVQGEVISSTFDEQASRHVQAAVMAINKAKRIVETHKKDVIILLDSITRLARAYNATAPSSGKVLTGGVDSNALHKPKRFFGAARCLEEGGSITIIATALVDTGSRMDEVIFEEFKGTGNSEIIMDRRLFDKRIFPAIDPVKSGTRREELLLSKEVIGKVTMLRRIMATMGSSAEAADFLQEKLRATKNNVDFFQSMNSNLK